MTSKQVFFMYAQNMIKLAFFSVLLIGSPLYATNRAACAKAFSNQRVIDSEKTFGTLPKRNSELYSNLVQDLKKQIQATNAYAILDLRSFISESSGLQWANSLPTGVGSQVLQGEVLYSKEGKFFKQEAPPWQSEGIANLQKWMRELIEDAVPDIELGAGFTNVRKSTEDGLGQIFDKWHIDGGRASVTLIFFGSDSGASGQFAPTIHRTPQKAGSRTLFVIRY